MRHQRTHAVKLTVRQTYHVAGILCHYNDHLNEYYLNIFADKCDYGNETMIVPKLQVDACSSYLTCSHGKKCTKLRVNFKKT